MAIVMRDCVAPHYLQGKSDLRILGLTASFINGTMKNAQKARRNLEALMNLTVLCPLVPRRLAATNYKTVEWQSTEGMSAQTEIIESAVKEKLLSLQGIKDIKKTCSRKIKEKAELLREIDEKAARCSMKLFDSLPALSAALDELIVSLTYSSEIQRARSTTYKAETLIDVLVAEFSNSDESHRGIVFVAQVALVSSLAKLLNDSKILTIACGAVVGSQHQRDSSREDDIRRFRNGQTRILVDTPTLEEGVDVPECAFVVRYTCVDTTKAHIQGSGRARHANVAIYYFDNDPVVELSKEDDMKQLARDTSKSLSQNALLCALKEMNSTAGDRHQQHR